MKYSFVIITCLILLTSFGCENTKGPQPVPDPTGDLSTGIWILNEGNFNWGNASLSWMSEEEEIFQNVFTDKNEIPLGDVAQSLTRIGNSVFIVVNNSGSVYKVNLISGEIESQISGLTSPRYILPISDQKAYISDLYSGSLTIINPWSATQTGEIPIGAWTEKMMLIGNEAWVTKMGTDKIVVIDINTDQVLDSIPVGREPNSLALDANGDVWVLCSGGLEEEIPELLRLDPSSRTIEAEFEFPDLQSSPNQLELSEDGQSLYFLDGNLFKMGIGDTSLAESPHIWADGRTFYNYKLQAPYVWITDAADFVQSGNLLKYDLSSGNLENIRTTGVIPSDILILE